MLFLNWDLKYTGLVTNFGPVPFVPWGTSRRFGRSKTHNEKASTAQDSVLAVGVKKKDSNPRHNSGAVTRISGDPSWKRLGKYMEWAAVDTLVKLTRGNVDAARTS